jgi:hypothetical protein
VLELSRCSFLQPLFKRASRTLALHLLSGWNERGKATCLRISNLECSVRFPCFTRKSGRRPIVGRELRRDVSLGSCCERLRATPNQSESECERKDSPAKLSEARREPNQLLFYALICSLSVSRLHLQRLRLFIIQA